MESHGPPRVPKRSPGEILGRFWKDIGKGVKGFREGFKVILTGFREDVGKALGRFVGTGGTWVSAGFVRIRSDFLVF